MSRLSDVNNAVRTLLGNVTLAKAVLAINAGGAATVKTTSAIPYTVDGIHYSKALLAAQSIAVTHDWRRQPGGAYVQPAGTTVYYTLGLDKTGAVCVVQGSYAGQKWGTDPTLGLGNGSNMGTSYQGTGDLPDVPDGFTAFGIMKVTTSGAATFTPGTTALDAANVAVSYFDVCLLPSVNP